MKTQHFIGPKARKLMMVIHSFHKADIKQTNKKKKFFGSNPCLNVISRSYSISSRKWLLMNFYYK